MNDLFDKLLKRKGDDWGSQLVSQAGFSESEATGFLPLMLDKLKSVFTSGKFDLTSLFGGTPDIAGLISNANLSGLAAKAGITEDKAKAGMETLAPEVVQKIQKKFDGPEDLLGALGGDAGGMLGGIAGKLFGK